MTPLLRPSVAVSNALCNAAGWFEDHGHPVAHDRLIGLRSTFDHWSCRLLLGHPRVIRGPTRDICLDCFTIVDEHPNGRGRS